MSPIVSDDLRLGGLRKISSSIPSKWLGVGAATTGSSSTLTTGSQRVGSGLTEMAPFGAPSTVNFFEHRQVIVWPSVCGGMVPVAPQYGHLTLIVALMGTLLVVKVEF
jgi:hypothetical protein